MALSADTSAVSPNQRTPHTLHIAKQMRFFASTVLATILLIMQAVPGLAVPHFEERGELCEDCPCPRCPPE
ncbi:hypothetical protein PENSPDRAFT_758797 [Peniophora sp. CONT]|nr:hypothetical protein PENSPDRAFT_758797 [Peniophora sp. CONT]